MVAASLGLVALVLLPVWLAVVIATGAIAAATIARRGLVLPLGWLVVSHALSVAMIALCLAAVGLPAAPTDAAGLLLATALAGVLVLAPAQIGTFESAFTLLAIHRGMAPETALAAAVLYHLADVIAPALAGLPALSLLSWRPAVSYTAGTARRYNPCRTG